MQKIIDDAFYDGGLNILILYTGLLLGVYIATAACTIISNQNLISLGNDVLKEIKRRIYEKILYMDLPFHCDNDVGYLNARIEEIEKIDVLFSSQTLSIGTSVLGLIFTIAMLWNISSEITLLFACPIPLLVLASFYFSKKITKQVRNTLDHTAEYSGKMQEALQGIEAIKSQGTEKEEGKKIDFYNRKALDSQRQQSYSMNKFSTGISSVGNIIKAIVYLIGGIFYIRGKITMGAFIAISAYVSKLYSPILYFAGMSIALQPAVTAMKRVSEFFFGEQKEDDDKHQKLSEIRDIKFKKVCFSYNIDEPLLNDINITIKRGDRIQLEGKNGSGKSQVQICV
jgi:ABC-type bacteriocin/lantibiotic exporter with double-glycine peptidase domain